MRLLLLSLLAVTFLSGCASSSINEPYTYDPNHSRAYNLARSVGLDELDDVEVAKSDLSNGWWDAITLGLDTASLMDPVYLDLDFGAAFGTGLLFSMAEPTDQIKRETIIAWVPESEVSATDPEEREKEALLWVANSLTTATLSTLDEFNISYRAVMRNQNIGLPFVFDDYKTFITGHSPNGNECMARYNVKSGSVSKRLPMPDFISDAEYGYKVFAGSDRQYPDGFVACFGRNMAQLNAKLQAEVSKKLPPSIFMYRPPYNMGDDGVYPPYIIDQGRSLFFVTAQNGNQSASEETSD